MKKEQFDNGRMQAFNMMLVGAATSQRYEEFDDAYDYAVQGVKDFELYFKDEVEQESVLTANEVHYDNSAFTALTLEGESDFALEVVLTPLSLLVNSAGRMVIVISIDKFKCVRIMDNKTTAMETVNISSFSHNWSKLILSY